MYKQEAVTFLMQTWESLALFCAHTKSNLFPKIERKIKEMENGKRMAKKETANLIPILRVTHSYFNFDREFVKSNFQYNPRWQLRWAPFLMMSRAKSPIFPVHLAC